MHNDEPPSPALTSSSWDSLPSDLEETFFLSGTEEIEEYERCKKRAWMDALREERLKERAKEDGVREKEAEERKGKGREPGWGDDGEEVSHCRFVLKAGYDVLPRSGCLIILIAGPVKLLQDSTVKQKLIPAA